MEKTNETKHPPTHTIWQVIGEKEKARWIRIGARWTNRDGKGFTLKFDAYPVAGRTLIREITDGNEAKGGQQ